MIDLFSKFDSTLARADRLISAGIVPYFRELQSRQDVEVIMEGKRRIMLGSNNYLGLTICPEVIEAGVKALEKYGTGCSGSRLLNGTLDLHMELEAELAQFLQKEDAITFSTGYQSNLGIISCLVGPHDYVICDRENHASIYAACRLSFGKMLRYKHNDMTDLENCLKQVPETAGALVVTDGVFSMGGDVANLPEIVRLAKKYGARTMVDDAHGLGVMGPGGRGTAFHFGLEKEVDVYMGTFSKSLAALGGYMAADKRTVSYARYTSSPFIFSAAIPPPTAAIALAALRHLKAHPELPLRLKALSEYARAGFTARGLRIRESAMAYPTPIIPIYTYSEEATFVAAQKVYEAGVYVNPVIPPATPPNEGLLRTSYMASHTEALLDEAMDIIAGVLVAN
ncbi:MAG: aminotransferase class I/II-fold pyridoxal phosphate-dependent enzyme [Kiritimatiellae bacterium]|nr:aminotransferase class I/II-fold pyridoxal phosphate-dependent enzyme [Kiritimatiellia bacterium]